MRKRWITGCLAAGLISLAAASAAGAAEYDYDELVVGSTTHLSGNFFTDLWGNAASDLDVRNLIHGYNLIRWDSENGLFVMDPSVVNGMVVTENENGDRTFRISIYEDMQYSDGTPITAKDYAFSILLETSPQVTELGALGTKGYYILGYGDYRSGNSEALAGVRLLGDYEFSVTVSSDYLPYFYELGLLNFGPAPIHVIAPGCGVADDGNGAYLTGKENFTADALAKTLLDEQSGYVYHPTVTSGPYVLRAFDGTTAEFEINPNYKGDADGLLPQIPRIVYTLAENDTMIEKLRDGSFGLLNKVTDAAAVDAGRTLTGEAGEYTMSSYPRSGLSFIAFDATRPAAGSQNVRQAIAWCIDRAALAKEYEGNIGFPVYGWYGIGQWQYTLVSAAPDEAPAVPGEDATDEEKEAYQTAMASYELDLDGVETYDTGDAQQNIENAVSLLEADGWTLNEQGGAFTAGTDSVRYKDIDGTLTPLALTLVYPEGNRIGALLETYLAAPLQSAGAQLNLKAVPMQALLQGYYGQTDLGCDMFYLATNFDLVFDPSEEFRSGADGALRWNGIGPVDGDLYALAGAMSGAAPGAVLDYCRSWVAFQERFAQVLPAIPVYSNVYFDFYTSALQGYDPAADQTWSQSVVGAYLSDAPAE